MSRLRLPLLALTLSLVACKSFAADEVTEADAGADAAVALPPCPNGALGFGGKAFVKVENDPSFDSPSDLTVEAWIFADKQLGKTQAHIVSHHDDNNSDGWTLFVEGALAFRVYGGSGKGNVAGGTVDEARDDSLTFGEWHHVAAVFDGEAKSITLFIDGHTRGRNFGNKTKADSYNGPLAFGAAAYLPSNGFIGTIDEVRVSNIVRYTPDTAFVPAYPLPDTEVGTIGTWHFLDGKTVKEVANDARGMFSASLATFATPTPEYPTAVLGTCPTGARR